MSVRCRIRVSNLYLCFLAHNTQLSRQLITWISCNAAVILSIKGSIPYFRITYQPNTLTYPRAVVIKLLNTIVADRAMRSPWWTVQKASVTKLHFHRVSVDRYILYSGYFQIRRLMIDPLHRRGGHVYLIWVRWYRVSWNDPGISTRSQEEKKKILHKQLTDQV